MTLKDATRNIAAAAVVAGVFSVPAAAAEYKWDLSNMFNEAALPSKSDMLFARLVGEKTHGKAEVVVHLNGSLGFKGSDHLDAVQDGALVLASSPLGAMVGIDPVFHLGTMPFLARTADEAKVLWDVSLPHFQAALKKQNQFAVAAFTLPPSGFWAKKPITSQADLKNWKVRVYDQIGQTIMRKGGAAAVNMIWNDVVPALSTGTIDGVLTAADAGFASKFDEYLPVFTEVNYVIPFGMIHMNLTVFEKLPKDVQAAVVAAGKDTTDWAFEAIKDRVKVNYAEMRARGMTIVTDVPPEFSAYLQEMATTSLKEWEAKMGPKGTAILAEFRARTGRK
jgi:TRAP-type C4-dicarboxylate transport system substrate-binding protein